MEIENFSILFNNNYLYEVQVQVSPMVKVEVKRKNSGKHFSNEKRFEFKNLEKIEMSENNFWNYVSV